MTAIIYTLCTITALISAVLLLRSYFSSRYRLLLWSGISFIGLFMNNLFLIIDRFIFPATDLSTCRLLIGLIAILPLLYGLVWEED